MGLGRCPTFLSFASLVPPSIPLQTCVDSCSLTSCWVWPIWEPSRSWRVAERRKRCQNMLHSCPPHTPYPPLQGEAVPTASHRATPVTVSQGIGNCFPSSLPAWEWYELSSGQLWPGCHPLWFPYTYTL